MVITASRWEMVDRKQGQKAVIKEHEFGLITDGPLFDFKFKLKMACKSIIHQKYKRSRFSKLKRLVIGVWRTEKKDVKKTREVQYEETGNREAVVLSLLCI